MKDVPERHITVLQYVLFSYRRPAYELSKEDARGDDTSNGPIYEGLREFDGTQMQHSCRISCTEGLSNPL